MLGQANGPRALDRSNDTGCCFDSSAAAAGDDARVCRHRTRIGPVRPPQADREQQDQELLRVPGRIDMPLCLRAF